MRKAPGGEKLTEANIRQIEMELGEECLPSVTRLKRRAGMLPLRPPPERPWLQNKDKSLGIGAEAKALGGAPSGSKGEISGAWTTASGNGFAALRAHSMQRELGLRPSAAGGAAPNGLTHRRLGSLLDPIGGPKSLGASATALGKSTKK